MERIERLVSKRGLSFAQMEAILEALANASVPIRFTANDLALQDGEPTGDFPSTAGEPEGDWQLRSLLKHSLLTAKQEVELGRAIRTGLLAAQESFSAVSSLHRDGAIRRGKEARDRLVTSNLRLVGKTARWYSSITDLETSDLFQDGVIGLIRAVDGFDPEAGFRFSTYATWWIRQAIQRAVQDRGRSIRLPAWVHDQVLRLNRATRVLWRENGRKPSLAILSEELALPPAHVSFLIDLSLLLPVSLDASSLDGDGEPLVETLASSCISPEESLLSAEESAILMNEVYGLPNKKMRSIILRRNGLQSNRAETLQEIGDSFGLTRERVRQIEKKAMDQLRISLTSKLREQSTVSRKELDSGGEN